MICAGARHMRWGKTHALGQDTCASTNGTVVGCVACSASGARTRASCALTWCCSIASFCRFAASWSGGMPLACIARPRAASCTCARVETTPPKIEKR